MRRDVQFLRGLAVLFVVIYHSGLGLLPQGFLGVDVFFVISGFLITKLILESLENNRFGFFEFYSRRARRLLPALYSTLIFTSLFGIFFLTNTQWTDYLNQLKGALTFSANMVLPVQTGYFDSEAEGKPLLHIWSLSLEEQYYFLLPLFLFLLPRSIRLWGLISAFTVSVVWCIFWVTAPNEEAPFLWRFGDVSRYEWAFYLLPTRAWELLAGSIVAWFSLHVKIIDPTTPVKYIALSTIIILGIIGITPTHPSVEAFFVVIATSLLLLGRDGWLPKISFTAAIEKIGDWSYSIYLVHWPLFAFSYLSFVGKIPLNVSIFLIFLSILLGFLQYRFIETPFRYRRLSKNHISWKPIALTTGLLAMVPLAISSNPLYGKYDFENIRRTNHGFGSECENSFNDDLTLKKECKSAGPVDTVVWGDSYAMHLIPGLIYQNKNVAQITKSVCGPFPGIAIVNEKYSEGWAAHCIRYNEKAFRYIKKSDTIKHVIMSSPLDNYISPGNQLLTKDGLKNSGIEIIEKSFSTTVKELRALGKTVTFISPPPKDGRNIGECLERKHGPAFTFFGDCSISRRDYSSNQYLVLKLLERFEKVSNVLYLSDLLCDETLCQVEREGVFLYRDNGHLSIEGSKVLLKDVVISDIGQLSVIPGG